MAYVGYWSRTVMIDILLSFNFVRSLRNVFPFPSSNAKLIDVPENRQNAAADFSLWIFFSILCALPINAG
jgi:hypothetical protein